MTSEELIQFSQRVQNLSIEELETEAEELKQQISQMIMNSDIVMRASIIDEVLRNKKGL